MRQKKLSLLTMGSSQEAAKKPPALDLFEVLNAAVEQGDWLLVVRERDEDESRSASNFNSRRDHVIKLPQTLAMRRRCCILSSAESSVEGALHWLPVSCARRWLRPSPLFPLRRGHRDGWIDAVTRRGSRALRGEELWVRSRQRSRAAALRDANAVADSTSPKRALRCRPPAPASSGEQGDQRAAGLRPPLLGDGRAPQPGDRPSTRPRPWSFTAASSPTFTPDELCELLHLLKTEHRCSRPAAPTSSRSSRSAASHHQPPDAPAPRVGGRTRRRPPPSSSAPQQAMPLPPSPCVARVPHKERERAARLPDGGADAARGRPPGERARPDARGVGAAARGGKAGVPARRDAVGRAADDRVRHLVDDRGEPHLGHCAARDAAAGGERVAAARADGRPRAPAALAALRGGARDVAASAVRAAAVALAVGLRRADVQVREPRAPRPPSQAREVAHEARDDRERVGRRRGRRRRRRRRARRVARRVRRTRRRCGGCSRSPGAARARCARSPSTTRGCAAARSS